MRSPSRSSGASTPSARRVDFEQDGGGVGLVHGVEAKHVVQQPGGLFRRSGDAHCSGLFRAVSAPSCVPGRVFLYYDRVTVAGKAPASLLGGGIGVG